MMSHEEVTGSGARGRDDGDVVIPVSQNAEPASETSRVPVQVAARTANRLEEAESTIEMLTARVAELEAALETSLADQNAMQLAHELEFAVMRAGAVDTEAVTLLAAAAMDGTDMKAEDAVGALLSSWPYLFGAPVTGEATPVRAPRGVASMPAAHTDPPLELAAREASRTGDRGALLRYLRLRRSAL